MISPRPAPTFDVVTPNLSSFRPSRSGKLALNGADATIMKQVPPVACWSRLLHVVRSLIRRSGRAAPEGIWLTTLRHWAALAGRFDVLTVTHGVGACTHRLLAVLHRHLTVRVWLRVVTVSCWQFGASVTARRCRTDRGFVQLVGLGALTHLHRCLATTLTVITFETATGWSCAKSTVRKATVPGVRRCRGANR